MGEAVTGAILIAVPILFNATFAQLASSFDYPDVLRKPTAEVLAAFREGGSRLLVTWWAFAMSALLFTPLVILLASQLGDADGTILALSVFIGVLASLVQVLGLVRWPFAVPYLAREAQKAKPGSARAEAVDVVFQSLNRYLGVAVGEHLGYLLTGAWSVFAGIAVIQSDAIPGWLGAIGIVLGPLFLLSSAEFLGRHEPEAWKLAGDLVPIAYILWSLWLAALGVALLV